MVTPASDIFRLTYPEYLALELSSGEKHEYVNGAVYAMAGGSIEHARLSGRVIAALSLGLRGKPCQVYSSDLRLRVEETGRSTYADATVVCGEARPASDDPQAVTNPRIVVEVLSESTERSDRGDKWRHYQSMESLEEYLLVSQGEPAVEVFRRTGADWRYHRFGPGQAFRLESVGVDLTVDELYAAGG